MNLHSQLRRLLRSRVFLATAVLVLGLGLGVNMVLFNAVYALLWRPLGFPQSDRLVTLRGRSAGGDIISSITGQNAWALRHESKAIESVGIIKRGGQVMLFNRAVPLEMLSAEVDSGYFKALGLRPVAGRLFGDEEDFGGNADPVAVLTESAWRNWFGSDPSVVNRVLTCQSGGNRCSVRIIGIVPSSATLPFAADADILSPNASASHEVRDNFGDAEYASVVRLKTGVSIAQASSVIDAALQVVERNTRFGVWGRHWVEPLRSALAPVNRQTVLWLYGSACLLLILTCANLSSLFVARAMARVHETSVHLALGASRWRLLLANFQEALLVCGGGITLAFLVENWTRPLIPQSIPQLKLVGPELLATGPMLVAFGLLACLVVSIVAAAAASWRITTLNPNASLLQGGQTRVSVAGRSRALLAAAQLAIVVTLLTMGALVGRSFLAAMRTDPGLNPAAVITFRVALPRLQATLSAITDLDRQIAAIPGVKNVAFAAELPVGEPSFGTMTAVHGGDMTPSDPMISYRLVGHSYFETLGARIVTGRSFMEEEVQQQRQVVVLNQSAARILFRGEQPVGRTMHSGFMNRKSVVVGVVRDIRTEGLDRASVPMVYMPYLQTAGFGLTFAVRVVGPFDAIVSMIKDRVHSWSSTALLRQVKPLQKIVNETVKDRIIAGMLVGGFALLGLIVSSVGLYGTLASHVQQRKHDIGIRIALGANSRNVMANILAEGLRIVALGSLVGVALSAVSARLIQNYLYDVSPFDPTSFILALTLLSAVALSACMIPAWRATRVDPIRDLRVQ